MSNFWGAVQTAIQAFRRPFLLLKNVETDYLAASGWLAAWLAAAALSPSLAKYLAWILPTKTNRHKGRLKTKNCST